MPKEILSYYLKNRDSQIRLGFQIALQCAPFLKRLKVSCVITMDACLYGTLEKIFRGMDIAWHCLSQSEGKCLVLFYRPLQMEEYLSEGKVRALLREYGYGGMDLEEMLEFSEEERAELDHKLQIASSFPGGNPEIRITYFVPDQKKDGGAWATLEGKIKRVDAYAKQVVMESGSVINIDCIVEICSI